MGEMKNVYKILVTLKGRDCFKVLYVDRIITFKQMLQQRYRMVGYRMLWGRFIWQGQRPVFGCGNKMVELWET
jgi:hypothetical protein